MSRNLLIGYLILLFGTLPWALPVWNSYLRDTVGRFITIQQFHLAEYALLGVLACGYGLKRRNRWWRLSALFGLTLLAGLLDEWIQSRLPQRYFEWSDVRLNWLGGLLGIAFAAPFNHRWTRGADGSLKGSPCVGHHPHRRRPDNLPHEAGTGQGIQKPESLPSGT